MQNGKWITDARPDAPAASVGCSLVAHRLNATLKLLGHADRGDAEVIHQLRVATRRANAALQAFKNGYDAGTVRKLRRTLRRIRRAAGDARTWDVTLAEAQKRLEHAAHKDAAGLQHLVSLALAERAAAQTDFARRLAKLKPKLKRLTQNLPGQSSKTGRKRRTLSKAATAQVQRRLAKLRNAFRSAPNSPGALHQGRIACKHLRYAMEVFAPCFEARFRGKLYSQVQAMQEALGACRDCQTVAEWLKTVAAEAERFVPNHWPRWRPGVEAWRRAAQRNAAAALRRFQKLWKSWPADEAVLALALPAGS